MPTAAPIATFPYTQGFENETQALLEGWLPQLDASSVPAAAGGWQLVRGATNKPQAYQRLAASGSVAFHTGNAAYGAGVRAQLFSPRFQFAALVRQPLLLFDVAVDSLAGVDGVVVQQLVNASWLSLGSVADASATARWYNAPALAAFNDRWLSGTRDNDTAGFTGQSGSWLTAAIALVHVADGAPTQLRFVFAASRTLVGTFGGASIDNIRVEQGRRRRARVASGAMCHSRRSQRRCRCARRSLRRSPTPPASRVRRSISSGVAIRANIRCCRAPTRHRVFF